MIDSSRLLLRRPNPLDGADILEMMLDAQTRQWNPARMAGHDVDDLASAVAWGLDTADWSDGSHASFAFVEVASGRYAGSVSVHSIDAEYHDAEIGYRTAPWARGRGYAREAVTAVTRWAFDNLHVVRIELAHAVANPASCAVATRSGYALEGVLRQSFVYGDGLRYDEHLHARLVTDG